MSDVMDVAANLLAAAVGALIALAWRAVRIRLTHRASRRLWRPVLTDPCHIFVSEHTIDRSSTALPLPSEVTSLEETHAVAHLLAKFAEARLPVRPHISTPGRAAPEQFRDNMIVLGGPLANTVALKLNESDLCGLRFAEAAGTIVVEDAETGHRYPPTRGKATVSGRTAEIRRDYGVIVSAPNPFNDSRRVLYCSGTSGRGTTAAVQVCLERARELVRRSRRFLRMPRRVRVGGRTTGGRQDRPDPAGEGRPLEGRRRYGHPPSRCGRPAAAARGAGQGSARDGHRTGHGAQGECGPVRTRDPPARRRRLTHLAPAFVLAPRAGPARGPPLPRRTRHALLKCTFRLLQRWRGCPQKITQLAAAALIILHVEDRRAA